MLVSDTTEGCVWTENQKNRGVQCIARVLALWPWARPVCFGFLICKTGISIQGDLKGLYVD